MSHVTSDKEPVPKKRTTWTREDFRLSVWSSRGVKLTDYDILCFYSASHCEICDKPFLRDRDRVLDHDHDTGLYRGALCQKCNTGLSRLGDQVKLAMLRLKKYGKAIKEREQKKKHVLEQERTIL